MGRIRKEKPKPHILIPDTSAIWHEDKHHCVDPEFDSFWAAYADQFGFELVIPEVVRGELLFQHTTSAIKSLRRANQAISDIVRVTQRQYSHRITEQRVKHEVEHKFRQWELKHHAKNLKQPSQLNILARTYSKSSLERPSICPRSPEPGQRARIP